MTTVIFAWALTVIFAWSKHGQSSPLTFARFTDINRRTLAFSGKNLALRLFFWQVKGPKDLCRRGRKR